MEQHVYDMLIIGGGPAGYTAGLYAGRAGLDAVVLEQMSVGGQMVLTDTIDNYPGFPDGVDGITLGMQMQAGAQRFGVPTVYAEVTGVSFSENIKQVQTTNGTYMAYTVILSMGANPRVLGIPGEEEWVGRGVHYCAHCDGRFYKDKTVAVIGGGNSAVSDALYLSRMAKQVYLVHRRDTLRATKIYHKPLQQAENITFCWNSTVVSLRTDDHVRGVVLQDTKTGEQREIACDGVFVSIGRQPATSFLKDAVALNKNGYIIADESTRTNIPGVFAAGDVRTKALRQVVTAAADGAVAVHYAEEYLAQNPMGKQSESN